MRLQKCTIPWTRGEMDQQRQDSSKYSDCKNPFCGKNLSVMAIGKSVPSYQVHAILLSNSSSAKSTHSWSLTTIIPTSTILSITAFSPWRSISSTILTTTKTPWRTFTLRSRSLSVCQRHKLRRNMKIFTEIFYM